MMPKMQEIFPDQLKNVTAEQMYRAVNKSGVSLLRMEADELTYNLHIILRYELERDVFEGRATVAELPKLWKQKMGAYLGIEPQDDRTGILQDIQWSMGQFGYFPAYALGNMYNAQYSARLKRELPFEQLRRDGNLAAIYDWKQKNLYCYGALYTPDELMNKVTGESLNAKYLVQHLTDKFSKLYEL
jgi:carboxypeptidase Taq